jgi:hypothetical protein
MGSACAVEVEEGEASLPADSAFHGICEHAVARTQAQTTVQVRVIMDLFIIVHKTQEPR